MKASTDIIGKAFKKMPTIETRQCNERIGKKGTTSKSPQDSREPLPAFQLAVLDVLKR